MLLGLLCVVEISDAFDGFVARKYGQVTDLGKILDPMADSICRISVFLTFTAPPVSLPLYFVFIILYRDSVISTLRTICALRGFALAARTSGKLKAVLLAAAAFSVLVAMVPYTKGWLSLGALQDISFAVVGVACVYTLLSGVEYIYANRGHIAKLLFVRGA